jgi:hypothetical protein
MTHHIVEFGTSGVDSLSGRNIVNAAAKPWSARTSLMVTFSTCSIAWIAIVMLLARFA